MRCLPGGAGFGYQVLVRESGVAAWFEELELGPVLFAGERVRYDAGEMLLIYKDCGAGSSC